MIMKCNDKLVLQKIGAQKPLHLVFILFIFFSCQNDQSSKVASEEVKEDSIAEWVNYEGKKELKKNKKIVFVSGDEEYRSEEALPQLAKILSQHHGFDCTVLFATRLESVSAARYNPMPVDPVTVKLLFV